MSRLLAPPIPHRENVGRLADYIEMECFRRADGKVSRMDVERVIEREHSTKAGLDVEQFTIDAFSELIQRADHCGSEVRYPFAISKDGSLCTFSRIPPRRRTRRMRLAMTYVYLLLATRMNMKSDRVQGGEDGTVLFEQMCKEVAIRYYGGPSESVEAIVFGTGRVDDLDDDDEIPARKFADAVNQLCDAMREGQRFDPKSLNAPVTAKDGKLDVVVWRRFADKRGGKLIGFGQCKTGTHWPNDLTKLQPPGFCAKWMRIEPAVDPVRFYFITDRPTLRWYDRCKDGGIMIDRCRIMEYADDLPISLSDRLINWVNSAMATEGLSLP